MNKKLIYFTLIILRVFIACRPSYIHPDEFFQGPEIVIGEILGRTHTRTWEFQAAAIRGIVPIYVFYAPVIYLLKALRQITPIQLFYGIRLQQVLWSLLIDLAIYRSAGSRRAILWASSYVSWMWFTHSFSNTHESILVLLAICAGRKESRSAYVALGLLTGLGCFTRISFLGFMVPTALYKAMSIARNYRKVLIAFTSFLSVCMVNVAIDSAYYGTLSVTPYNNFLYNSKLENLAQHGLHPRYTHFLYVFMLLGPLTLRFWSSRWKSVYLQSAMNGFLVLSVAPHQEARFLLPCIPLFFISIRSNLSRPLLVSWIVFNAIIGAFYGTSHQSGVIPMALHLSQYTALNVSWTKSYPAPQFLLGKANVTHIYGDINATKYGDHLVLPIMHGKHLKQYALQWHYPHHFALDDFSTHGFTFSDRGLGYYHRIDEHTTTH